MAYFCELFCILSDLVHDSLEYANISSFFFRKTGNRASTMSEVEKSYRLWSMATKTCLVLTVKNNKVDVTCTKSVSYDDSAAGESSRLQLFMLIGICFFRLFSSTCTSS